MQSPKRVSATPADDSLKINGNKIKLEKFPHEIKINYNVRRSHYNFDRPSDKHHRETTKVSRERRQLYNLKTKNYTNLEVRNRRLKEIHEAVELDDFKRFLVKNNNNNKQGVKGDVTFSAAAAAVVNLDLVKNIYWENFEKHYKFLKNLINKGGSKCCE